MYWLDRGDCQILDSIFSPFSFILWESLCYPRVATEYMFWLALIQALLFSLMLAGLDISLHFQKQGLKT